MMKLFIAIAAMFALMSDTEAFVRTATGGGFHPDVEAWCDALLTRGSSCAGVRVTTDRRWPGGSGSTSRGTRSTSTGTPAESQCSTHSTDRTFGWHGTSFKACGVPTSPTWTSLPTTQYGGAAPFFSTRAWAGVASASRPTHRTTTTSSRSAAVPWSRPPQALTVDWLHLRSTTERAPAARAR